MEYWNDPNCTNSLTMIPWLSRISGMELWNGNTGMGKLMLKNCYFINTWISDEDYQQGYQLREGAKM